ncbi:hypothetical protein [Streptomyces sp. NK15101]|uniref:hypothetical protein n=1 Tax=Streptomyces sp. NK15101 TaxID=2873261 RepID=UPI001CECF615|nr:hypothetical protein [Streptomyces sp. NK15101]
MIELSFSVRPEQGEPSGFDLGDMRCEGERGTATSVGHVPDQGMMIHLSVPLLLDSLRQLFGGASVASFTGVATSFRLDFRRTRNGRVTVSARRKALGTADLDELARAVLRPARKLAEEDLSRLPAGDGAVNDYLGSLRRFSAIAG